MSYRFTALDGPVVEAEFDSPFLSASPNLSPEEYYEDTAARLHDSAAISAQHGDKEELLHEVSLLKMNVTSLLVLRNAIDVSNVRGAPQDMVDPSLDGSWFQAANSTLTYFDWLGTHMVSYECENGGAPFVHLSPQKGSGKGNEKSRKSMRGHTDGLYFPVNVEERYQGQPLPPGPDTVVLVGIRNNNNVPTRIAPLSFVVSTLSRSDVDLTSQPNYVFSPQSSFSLEGFEPQAGQRVLDRTQQDGIRIRFSHSSIRPMDGPNSEALQTAFDNLCASVARSYVDVAIGPGDLVFVNNCTAIHGRAEVGMPEKEDEKRWLLRTYTQHTVASQFTDVRSPDFVLKIGDKNE